MKICSKCKENKPLNEFNKSGKGYHAYCRSCCKEYYARYRADNPNKQEEYYAKNKERISLLSRERYLKNRDDILSKQKLYNSSRKEALSKYGKIWRDINKEYLSDYYKERHIKNKVTEREKSAAYYQRNKVSKSQKSKSYHSSPAKYDIHFDKLTVEEEPRIAADGVLLEVKCKYCGKYFTPTNVMALSRRQSLSGEVNGDNFMYCSEDCKASCPIYKQRKYPKDYKRINVRDVDPYVRKLCFERDNWECQICGSIEALHCHHIEGYTQNMILSNDVTNCITLCKSCHKGVHRVKGCRYADLKCIEK